MGRTSVVSAGRNRADLRRIRTKGSSRERRAGRGADSVAGRAMREDSARATTKDET